ncbi:MAG: DNA mismatch repair endonuclease MutL, partial [Alphaproteobacteria bacterium]|nr:DNA mismatch repair endonuclease MutL [Alphaproteobacteria bacterium]
MSGLRRLPSTLVNRIAAGEVVERPASAVKELVENAIDAGAGRIAVTLKEGGRSLIVVIDDGVGMTAEELALAVERHCTSKLPSDDLSDIRTLGFRGEALPSIASVSRFAISSRPAGAREAWTLEIDGGVKGTPKPAAHPAGTRVEVRDLFFATPARLKFLKEPRTEAAHVADALRRLAMAHPEVAFRLESEERALIDLPAAAPSLIEQPDEARLARLAAIMGRDFADNALAIDANREGFRLTGFAGLPTLNRPTGQHQYLFVNGRPVRDKLLAGAVRGAYQDFLARERHPMVALFLEAPAALVDVNVHPAKTEVRFRDSGLVRGLIVGALRTALSAAGHRASTTVAHAALGALRPHTGYATPLPMGFAQRPSLPPRGLAEAAAEFMAPLDMPSARVEAPVEAPVEAGNGGAASYPLGVARAQLHETYIVAQTPHGVVIVDQHAAHERLVHERLKDQLQAEGVKRQALLL